MPQELLPGCLEPASLERHTPNTPTPHHLHGGYFVDRSARVILHVTEQGDGYLINICDRLTTATKLQVGEQRLTLAKKDNETTEDDPVPAAKKLVVLQDADFFHTFFVACIHGALVIANLRMFPEVSGEVDEGVQTTGWHKKHSVVSTSPSSSAY